LPLRPYVGEKRQQYDRDTWSEWFQWLAERMMEREKVKVAAIDSIAPGGSVNRPYL